VAKLRLGRLPVLARRDTGVEGARRGCSSSSEARSVGGLPIRLRFCDVRVNHKETGL
jgi:hypothetical protein